MDFSSSVSRDSNLSGITIAADTDHEQAVIRQIVVKIIALILLIWFSWNYALKGPGHSVVEAQKEPPYEQILKSRDTINHRYNVIENVTTIQITLTPTPTPKKSALSLPNTDTVSLARQVARDFSINEDTFLCVLQHESGLNSRTADGSLKCGDNGRSCGLGQIQYPTWVSIRRNAGWSTEDLRGDDYENLKTTAYGLKTSWKYHWSGYRLCEAQGYSLKP